MDALRQAAQAALEALEWGRDDLSENAAAGLRAALAAEPTRSQKLTDAGFHRRPSLWAMQARQALELIAAPMRSDGTWNRDREACRRLAAEALGRDETPATTTAAQDPFLAGISYPPPQEPAPDTVPWPVVSRYSGGGSADGVAGRVWVRLGDGPDEVEYVPAEPAPLTDAQIDAAIRQALGKMNALKGTYDYLDLHSVARAIERAIREPKP